MKNKNKKNNKRKGIRKTPRTRTGKLIIIPIKVKATVVRTIITIVTIII